VQTGRALSLNEHASGRQVLSMVLNCEPSPERRGTMLRLAARALRKGGLLLLALPRACVDNSRYCSRREMLLLTRTLGLRALRVSASARLVR
jgi:25S rRNA (adenine2142-N1)-methyltransferase